MNPGLDKVYAPPRFSEVLPHVGALSFSTEESKIRPI